MKRIALLLVWTSMIALGAAPAAAKQGAHRARLSAYVSGPGLTAPIVLRGHDAGFLYYLTTQAGYGQPRAEPRAPALLGARYDVMYFAQTQEGQTFVVNQVLYPFARTAAWAWTLPGQRFAQGFGGAVVVPSGWWHSVALQDRLAEWGLTRSTPRAPATVVVSKGHGSLAWVWLWMGVLLVSVGLTRVALTRRRRSIATPSTTVR